MPPLKKTNVYVDGFNLYYGIQAKPYKWLNVAELCRRTLPQSAINRIRCFTAYVKVRASDTETRRQLVYLRAPKTILNLAIHCGEFLVSRVQTYSR